LIADLRGKKKQNDVGREGKIQLSSVSRAEEVGRKKHERGGWEDGRRRRRVASRGERPLDAFLLLPSRERKEAKKEEEEKVCLHSVRTSIPSKRNEPQTKVLHRVLDLLTRGLVDSESFGKGRGVLGDVGEGSMQSVDELDGGCFKHGPGNKMQGRRRVRGTKRTRSRSGKKLRSRIRLDSRVAK